VLPAFARWAASVVAGIRKAVLRVLGAGLPDPRAVTRVESLSGGASAETWAVDVIDGADRTHALILRSSAGGGAGVFNPGVGKREEALIQQAAQRAGVPAVEVLAIFEQDARICQFQVFAHLNGMARSVEHAAIGRRITEVELDLLLLLQGKL
jgi:aminoglycoside phosphotransferase (APT) family kinase protein